MRSINRPGGKSSIEVDAWKDRLKLQVAETERIRDLNEKLMALNNTEHGRVVEQVMEIRRLNEDIKIRDTAISGLARVIESMANRSHP